MNADETAKSPNSGAFKPTTSAAQPPVEQPTSGTTPVRRSGVLPTTSAQPGVSSTGGAPASIPPRTFAPTGATSPAGTTAPVDKAPATGNPTSTGTVPQRSSTPASGSVPPNGSLPASGSVPQRSAFRPISDTTVAAGATAAAATTAGSGSVTSPTVPQRAPLVPDSGTTQAGALSLTDKMKGLTTRAKDGTRDQLEKADREQAAQAGTGPRKARVLVSRIDPWSVLKIAFLLSIAAGIMLVVAIHVLWNVLSQMGVFVMINEWVLKLFTADQELNILQFVAYPKVMSAALLIAVVNVVLLTGLATIAAFLYNTIARVVGGIYVTLTDD